MNTLDIFFAGVGMIVGCALFIFFLLGIDNYSI